MKKKIQSDYFEYISSTKAADFTYFFYRVLLLFCRFSVQSNFPF